MAEQSSVGRRRLWYDKVNPVRTHVSVGWGRIR